MIVMLSLSGSMRQLHHGQQINTRRDSHMEEYDDGSKELMIIPSGRKMNLE
jgi:hypothetical protein